MKKIIAWILLLIVLAGGVYWINKLSYKASPLVQDSINSTDSWKTYMVLKLSILQIGYMKKIY